MAKIEVVTLVCDGCGTEEGVEPREAKLDGSHVQLDVCKKCWDAATTKLRKLMTKGRRVRAARKGRGKTSK